MNSDIRIAHSDGDILACHPVMHELRPHVAAEAFVPRVREMEAFGYRLAGLHQGDRVVSVAGYRIGHNLAWGRLLYLEDLVTLTSERSQGYGRRMLAWLREQALQEGCAHLLLDSGLQRLDAHRFYAREGVEKVGFHFVWRIGNP